MAGTMAQLSMECSVKVHRISVRYLVLDVERAGISIGYVNPMIYDISGCRYTAERSFTGFWLNYDFASYLKLLEVKSVFANSLRFASLPEVLQCHTLVPYLLSTKRAAIAVPGSLVSGHLFPLISWEEESLHFRLASDEDEKLNLSGFFVYLIGGCSKD